MAQEFRILLLDDICQNTGYGIILQYRFKRPVSCHMLWHKTIVCYSITFVVRHVTPQGKSKIWQYSHDSIFFFFCSCGSYRYSRSSGAWRQVEKKWIEPRKHENIERKDIGDNHKIYKSSWIWLWRISMFIFRVVERQLAFRRNYIPWLGKGWIFNTTVCIPPRAWAIHTIKLEFSLSFSLDYLMLYWWCLTLL